MRSPSQYPEWVLRVVTPGTIFQDEAELMQASINVARANIKATLGGPFGAIVATESGEVISIGYNEVVPTGDSTAHAEVVALRRAETVYQTYRLRGEGLPKLKLFTTCAPCIMCTGAIHWSGIPEVIAAARTSDAEAVGFVEGPKELDAPVFFKARDIAYRADFLREEAVEVLRSYQGGIYNG